MGDGGSVTTSSRALRASDWYAVFHGTPYRAGPDSDSHKVNLYWRRADGSWGSAVDAPTGFELNAEGNAGVRTVEMSDLERYYELRVTCMYRGGGPFLVKKVEHAASSQAVLYVVYEGGDREWALSQPGMGPNPAPLDAWQETQVMGRIPVAEAEFLREDIEDIKIPRRRRKAASA